MLPAGTKLPLGLLRPLRVKPGRDVYLQITFPVTVGNQMLIPPGAYVQGIVERVIKKDRRSLQFTISSANLIFFNGYTVPISGTVTASTTNAALTAIVSLYLPWPLWAVWLRRRCRRCRRCPLSTAIETR